MKETTVSHPTGVLRQLLGNEAVSGILLALFAALALVIANSPLSTVYQSILDTTVAIKVGDAGLEKPFLLWVNDGLMAVFFLLVGLELKRALLQGELSNMRQAALPAIAALGGMVVPVVIYAAMNWGDTLALRGWAIPAATDIAFALGVLALLGPRIPIALKMFLMAVAVGASCAFLTPIGHQCNTLVLGPGGYRFGDYWRMGLPLEVLIVCVAVPLILRVWPA